MRDFWSCQIERSVNIQRTKSIADRRSADSSKYLVDLTSHRLRAFFQLLQ